MDVLPVCMSMYREYSLYPRPEEGIEIYLGLELQMVQASQGP